MAKLGQLYLNHGIWHEKQIIPADWIRESTTKQVDSIEGTYGYGYQIWMENRLNSFEFNGMLGQNVIIQSIGASSGVIVAGAIFTLPALYILGLDAKFYQIFLSSLLGGLLGILMLIPFRKYFVKDMHGKYPFPEKSIH